MKNKQEKLHTNRANGRQTKLVYVIDVDKLLFFSLTPIIWIQFIVEEIIVPPNLK